MQKAERCEMSRAGQGQGDPFRLDSFSLLSLVFFLNLSSLHSYTQRPARVDRFRNFVPRRLYTTAYSYRYAATLVDARCDQPMFIVNLKPSDRLGLGLGGARGVGLLPPLPIWYTGITSSPTTIRAASPTAIRAAPHAGCSGGTNTAPISICNLPSRLSPFRPEQDGSLMLMAAYWLSTRHHQSAQRAGRSA